MKKLILVLSLIISGLYGNAQNHETTKPIANYRIVKADSTISTQANLNRKKPVMIVYFEPTCTHCEHLMEELRPHMDKLKKVQVVMITYTRTNYPYLSMLSSFSKKFKLSKYPNFTVGTEHPDYKVQRYYEIFNTPYIVVYDSKGKVAKSFTVVPEDVNDLLKVIKKVSA
jgi:thiol-disulfide isomerase/thioredoxin